MKVIKKAIATLFLLIGAVIFVIPKVYASNSSYDGNYGLIQVDIEDINRNNDSLLISFDYNENLYFLDVSLYQYFTVIEKNTHQIRYIIADVLENPHETYFDVARILIYTHGNLYLNFEDISIEIIMYMFDSEELINVLGNIHHDSIDFIIANSILWDDLVEETSDRLITSLNIVESYLYSQSQQEERSKSRFNDQFIITELDGGGGGSNSNTTPSNIKANREKTVNLYQYDSYTNSDQYVKNYSLPNNSSWTYDLKTTDDDIIKIIPKELFFKQGVYTYIGKEYGFFVNTIQQKMYLYTVEVLVFDIEVIKPGISLPIAEGKAKVVPLFQYKYYAKEKGTMSNADWNLDYDSSLKSVVFPHLTYDAPNYYLKNIGFRFTVDNYVSKNYGDNGYAANSDSGDFVLQSRYNFSGEGKKTGRNSFVLETALFAFGFVKGWKGVAASILSYGIDVYQNISQGNYKYSRPASFYDNEANINTNYEYREDQITYYGNLLKSVKVLPQGQTDDFDDPVLVGTRVENNYAQGIVVMTNEGGQSASQESRFYTSVRVDVAYDGTHFIFGWIKTGTVETIDSSSSVYNYGNYKRGTQLVDDNQVVHNTITKPGETKYFKFIPSRNGEYTFETTGSSDTIITILDIEGEVVGFDDNSGTNNNAKVTKVLKRNKTYYIQAKMKYESHIGSFDLKAGYGVSGILQLGIQIESRLLNQFVVYRFKPGSTGKYVIQTLGTLNTVISVYDSSSNLVAYNDNWYDSSGKLNYNAKVITNLKGNSNYYVKVHRNGLLNIISYDVATVATQTY